MDSAVVIGTGLMGPSIAAALAEAGLSVTIVGRSISRQAKAVERARTMMSASHADSLRAGDWSRTTFSNVDIVCEAVIESVPIKLEVLERVARLAGNETLITTNTSSLRPTDLASAVADPQRFAGVHFLNPAHLTSVIELVPSEKTSQNTMDQLINLAARLDKKPIVVRREVAGFVWNRIQMAVLRECVNLVEAGVADVNEIDMAVSDGLAPRWVAAGPLMTADLGGVELFASIAEVVFPTLSNTTAPQERLRNGEPFYAWRPEDQPAIQELRDRALRVGRELGRGRRWPSVQNHKPRRR